MDRQIDKYIDKQIDLTEPIKIYIYMNQLQEAYDIFRDAGGFEILYFGRIYALTLKRLMGGRVFNK